MSKKNNRLIQQINQFYTFKGASFRIGSALFNQQPIDAPIHIPLKTLNRHGLITGATGTGKTKTIQLLCELLSEQGIPVLVMDLKGDLSGLGAPGEVNPQIKTRMNSIGLPFKPEAFPIEFLTLEESKGVKLRATVSEFGPVLFSKMLGLNDNQEGVVTIIYKYCKDNQLPLLDLKDFKKVLLYTTQEGQETITEQYGHIAKQSGATVLRKIIELESQGGNQFFGEPSFNVNDLLQKDQKDFGKIFIIDLAAMQSKTKLFSSFVLNLLSESYSSFPEVGDLPKPKLIIFVDEAHLLFKNSTRALLSQIETIVKLIRSKGVGLFFCTQSPTDIPDTVLSQLGLKIQHALRAFTAKDRKAIKLVAENFPISEYYDTKSLLTSMGIGEALVTALDEKGRPTPLAATLLRAPVSRMSPLTQEEKNKIISNSELVRRYEKPIDRESAYEILNEKLQKPKEDLTEVETSKRRRTRQGKSFLEQLSENTLVRQAGRTAVREFVRGLLSALGLRKKK